ncbi:MAG: methyltransferase domain-containing protein [Nitrospirae bacterium]|nr:methyltransferase domain-containing protein [Nitrospirota bacterium]
MYKLLKSIIHKISFYPYYLIEQKSREFIVSSVNSACSGKNKGIALDIGSGDRVNQQYIPSCWQYVALDYPSDPSERCKQTKSPDIWGDGCQLPIKSNKISLVISTCVIEHVREPMQFFSEVHRVLVTSGVFIFSTNQTFRTHEAPFDYWRFTCYGLRELLTKSGFEIIKIEPSNISSFLTGWLVVLDDIFKIGSKGSLPLALLLSIPFWILYPLFNKIKEKQDMANPIIWLVYAKKE